jgi:hypothetical protein
VLRRERHLAAHHECGEARARRAGRVDPTAHPSAAEHRAVLAERDDLVELVRDDAGALN